MSLYMWRFAGTSFGLERQFWWTLLAACAAGVITASGAILFRFITMHISEATWLTHALEEGLAYDGTSTVPHNITAYAAWGSGEWQWMAYTVGGGGVIAVLKLLSTFLTVFFGAFDKDERHEHSRVFPRLTPNLVVEVGSLQGHVVHGFFVLLCGAVAIGCGASVGPEAPNGSFGAGVGAGLHRLLRPRGVRADIAEGVGHSEEWVLIGMACAFANIFPGLLCSLALLLELNILTTIISVAAVKGSIAALREQDDPHSALHSASHAAGPGVGRRGGGCFGGCFGGDVAANAKRSAAAPDELPHSKFRFDFAQYCIYVTLGGGLGIAIYSAVDATTFLSNADLTSERLILDTGVSTADALHFALQQAIPSDSFRLPPTPSDSFRLLPTPSDSSDSFRLLPTPSDSFRLLPTLSDSFRLFPTLSDSPVCRRRGSCGRGTTLQPPPSAPLAACSLSRARSRAPCCRRSACGCSVGSTRRASTRRGPRAPAYCARGCSACARTAPCATRSSASGRCFRPAVPSSSLASPLIPLGAVPLLILP